MRGPVPPRALETIAEPAVHQALQPVHCNRGSRTVARQTFQSRPIVGMHGHVCMQAEPIDGGAAWTARHIHALRVDRIRRPDSREFPVLPILTDDRGEFTHEIDTLLLEIGTHELWVVDDTSRVSSNVVRFEVTPEPPPSANR